MSASPPRPKIGIYRPPGRPGVDQTLVEVTANRLLEQGERPTVNRVRQLIGGSPNTIAPLLDAWWRRLGQRLQSKVPSALDRLPGQLGLIAEAFFVEALEQARIRANAELSKDRETIEQQRQDAEVRSHLLSLREQELSALVQSHAKRVEELEAQIRDHITFERKLLGAKEALERRVQELLEELAKQRQTTGLKKAGGKITRALSRLAVSPKPRRGGAKAPPPQKKRDFGTARTPARKITVRRRGARTQTRRR